MAAVWKIACVSRSKSSMPCARTGRGISRYRCAFPLPTGRRGGITPEDGLRVAAMFKAHGADIIDVSAGMTSRWANPVYGRMFQTPFSEMIRNEVGVATIAVGAITTADQINTIIAAGRADLCALARPHLTNPHFTLVASAEYGYAAASLAVALSPGQGPGLPAVSAAAGRTAGVAAGGKAVQPRPASRPETGRRIGLS